MQIIFDLDGTLFQTKYGVINAINRLFDELNIDRVSENKVTMNIGKTTYEFLQCLLPNNVNLKHILQRYREIEQEEVQKKCLLFHNVKKVLNELKNKGHELFVCSAGSIEYIELVLFKTEIADFFKQIHSANTNKSKSEIIKDIIVNDSKAVVIGDSHTDINAAKFNKIPSIACLYGYGFSDTDTFATFNATNFDEITGFISQLDIFFYIRDSLIHKGKKIIGINGVDTSGKTQFTLRLSRFLKDIDIKNEVLHIDDYHNPLSVRKYGENEIEAYYKNAFNYEMLISEVLEPLKENGNINKTVLCLNLETDRYEKSVHYDIDESTVLLIEGVLLFRPPLLEYLHGKVFLYIDFEEVIKRARNRDVPKYGIAFLNKYIEKYIPIQKRYISEFNPELNSDIVINNQDFMNPTLKDI